MGMANTKVSFAKSFSLGTALSYSAPWIYMIFFFQKVQVVHYQVPTITTISIFFCIFCAAFIMITLILYSFVQISEYDVTGHH